LVVRVADFSLIVGELYKMGPDDIMRRCVMEAERPLILAKEHEGIAGGHYVRKETTQKVLRDGLWWPTCTQRCEGILQILKPTKQGARYIITMT
jgi:hypothetical protein